MAKKKEKEEKNMKESARIDLVKLDSRHCWFCGNVMGGENKKTKHHAIPEFLKPKRNVIVPVCLPCHQEINKYMVQGLPNFKAMKGFLENIEKFVEKHKKTIEKYEKG
jgi:hypothetical protein